MTVLDDLIGAHASFPPPSDDQRARARARLHTVIDATEAGPRPSRRRWHAGLVLSAAVLILFFAIAEPWRSSGTDIPVGPEAAVAASCNSASQPAAICLHAFAAVARAQAAVSHGLVYWEHEIDYGSVGQHITREDAAKAGLPASRITHPFFVNRKAEIEVYLTPDKHVYATARGIQALFPTAADRAAWEADGSPGLAGWLRTSPETSPLARGISARAFYSLTGGQIDQLDIEHLPETAAGLLHELRHITALELPGTPDAAACAEQRSRCSLKTRGIMNRYVLENLLSLLRYPFTSPASRGTIFEAFSRLHGARLLGRVTDPEGRPGIGILVTHNPDENVLVFQPNTGQLLATGLLTHPSPSRIDETHWWGAYLVQTGVSHAVPASIKRGPPYCCG
jgi:hypothetical protein